MLLREPGHPSWRVAFDYPLLLLFPKFPTAHGELDAQVALCAAHSGREVCDSDGQHSPSPASSVGSSGFSLGPTREHRSVWCLPCTLLPVPPPSMDNDTMLVLFTPEPLSRPVLCTQ